MVSRIGLRAALKVQLGPMPSAVVSQLLGVPDGALRTVEVSEGLSASKRPQDW
jgi:hypothetical protein